MRPVLKGLTTSQQALPLFWLLPLVPLCVLNTHTQQTEHLLWVRLRSGLLAARQAGSLYPGPPPPARFEMTETELNKKRFWWQVVTSSTGPRTTETAVKVTLNCQKIIVMMLCRSPEHRVDLSCRFLLAKQKSMPCWTVHLLGGRLQQGFL